MTDYLTEQEQIELLKGWIKQYSLVILAAVLVAVISITGWRYWQQRQMKILSHASSVYDEMLVKRAQHDSAATLIQARKLFKHYDNTVYGSMAAFVLARDAVLKKDYLEAEKRLSWVVDHSHVDSFRQIARIRLARVYIAEQKPEDAINALKKVNDKHFSGFINETRGDAYFAANNLAKARESYQQALKDMPNAEVMRPLLQMKYDNLNTESLSG